MFSLALHQPDTPSCGRRRRHPPSSSYPPSTPSACAQFLGLSHELEEVGALLHVLGHVCAEDSLDYRLARVSELGASKPGENVVRPSRLQDHLRVSFGSFKHKSVRVQVTCVCICVFAKTCMNNPEPFLTKEENVEIFRGMFRVIIAQQYLCLPRSGHDITGV